MNSLRSLCSSTSSVRVCDRIAAERYRDGNGNEATWLLLCEEASDDKWKIYEFDSGFTTVLGVQSGVVVNFDSSEYIGPDPRPPHNVVKFYRVLREQNAQIVARALAALATFRRVNKEFPTASC